MVEAYTLGGSDHVILKSKCRVLQKCQAGGSIHMEILEAVRRSGPRKMQGEGGLWTLSRSETLFVCSCLD